MLKPVTQIYQEQLDETLKVRAKEQRNDERKTEGEILEKYEIWSNGTTTKEVIQTLIARREALIVLCMKECSDSTKISNVLSNLREAKTLTETINLMQTGEYKL